MRILLFVLIPIVFFGAGMLFASLLWGKYKELTHTLKHRLALEKEQFSTLEQKLGDLRKAHAEQSVTCQTLEEALSNIGKEREEALAIAAQDRAAKSRLLRYEAECRELKAALDAQQTQAATEESSSQDAIRAAENRARQLLKEKEDLIQLIGKLQDKLNQIAPLQKELIEVNAKADEHAFQTRRERIKARSIARHRQSARDSVARRTPERASVRKHSHHNQPPVPSDPSVQTTSTTKPTNSPTLGITQRVLARLLPQGKSTPITKDDAMSRPGRHC